MGYVQVCDSKARNPQVVQNIISRDNPLPVDPGPDLTGNEGLTARFDFGIRKLACGGTTPPAAVIARGFRPFLVVAPHDSAMPDHMMLAGRSYTQ